eukprot:scaffold22516_cov135-Isochrysis_galbana.AAC.1
MCDPSRYPEIRAARFLYNRGKPQLGRWAFYWKGVFGAAQNVGRFWCRDPQPGSCGSAVEHPLKKIASPTLECSASEGSRRQ